MENISKQKKLQILENKLRKIIREELKNSPSSILLKEEYETLDISDIEGKTVKSVIFPSSKRVIVLIFNDETTLTINQISEQQISYISTKR